MIFLLAMHLFLNYRAVKAVCMRTLNRQRANIVFSSIVADIDDHLFSERLTLSGKSTEEWISALSEKALFIRPEDVYLREKVFERDGILRGRRNEILGFCRLGVKLGEILQLFSEENPTTGSYNATSTLQFAQLWDVFANAEYIMWYDEARETFLVVLKKSSPENHLLAWFHAHLFMRFWRSGSGKGGSVLDVLRVSYGLACGGWDVVRPRLCESGWDLEVDAMLTRECTCIQVDLGEKSEG